MTYLVCDQFHLTSCLCVDSYRYKITMNPGEWSSLGGALFHVNQEVSGVLFAVNGWRSSLFICRSCDSIWLSPYELLVIGSSASVRRTLLGVKDENDS